MKRQKTMVRKLFMTMLFASSAFLAFPSSHAYIPGSEKSNYVYDTLEFREALVVDAVRVLSEISGANIVTTEGAAKKKVTVFLRDMTVEDAIDTICKVTGLWYRKDPSTGVFRIMETEEYQKDMVVYRDDLLRVFTLRHYNVVSAAYAIENLFGDRVELELDRRPDDTGLGGAASLGFGFGGNNSNNGFDRSNLRDNVNNFNSQSGFMNGGAGASSTLGRASALDGVELTSGQLEKLRESESVSGLPGVSTTEIVQVTRREPPIMVTTSRLHNLVMVRTTDSAAMDEIEDLLIQIDRVAPQVLLEMRILDLALGDTFRSVFDIEYTSSESATGPESAAPRNPLLPGGLAAPAAAMGFGNFPLEGGTLLFQWMNDNILLRLQLMEEDKRVSTLATPTLLASNNTPARLFIGEEVVLTTGVSTTSQVGSQGQVINLTSPETEVVSIGNTLEILPRVNSDDSVTLTIKADVSSLKPNGSTIPVTGPNGVVSEFSVDAVNNSSLEGTFLAQDGLTVAVGGLIRRTESDNEKKVPWLGDIRWLGFFFKEQERGKTSSELVLLITPRVFFTGEDAEKRSIEALETMSTETLEGRFEIVPPSLAEEMKKEESSAASDTTEVPVIEPISPENP